MIDITFLVSQDDHNIRQHIFKLRYDVLVKEQAKHPEHADHETETLAEPLDKNSFLFAATVTDDVMGTCRVNYLRDYKDPFYAAAYNLDYFIQNGMGDQVGIVSRLILHPAYRGSVSFKLMVKAIFRELLKNEISILVIDCALALVPFYKKLGLLPYGPVFTHKDGMVVMPMVLDANNRARLIEINSVLMNDYPEDFRPNEAIKAKVHHLVQQATCKELHLA